MELTEKQLEAMDVERHVVMRAGAGSGKTHVLTERYVSLLEKRKAAVDEIVTITFTEKAATEMRERVRGKLRDRVIEAWRAGDADEIRYWESAMDSLPDAKITTIHSFCSSLLREDPVRAGVDPDFETLDDAASGLLLGAAISDFIDERKTDAEYGPLRVLSGMWGRDALAGVLNLMFSKRSKAEKWARLTDAATEEEIIARQKKVAAKWQRIVLRDCDFENLLPIVDNLDCQSEEDKQYPALQAAKEFFRQLAAASDGDFGKVNFLLLANMNFTGGAKKNWAPGDLDKWKEIRHELRDAGATLAKYTWTEHDDASVPVQKALARLFLDVREMYNELKGNGRALDFDDLQEKALDYLVNAPAAAAALRKKFPFLMIDEFQDTDALQWDIAKVIARDDEGFADNMFIVGDEKQSIYAFRGADVRVFGIAKDELAGESGREVTLDANFRSNPGLVKFFNLIFPCVFAARQAPGSPKIKCEKIDPRRDDAPDGPPRVCILSNGEIDDNSPFASRHEMEAEMVARHLKGMLVSDPATQVWDKKRKCLRPMRIDDAAVLFRSRTHVSAYEDAFRRNGLEFINVSGFGFFEAREVMDLVNLMEFLADPRNEIALAAALRSPLFHLSDEEMLRVALTETGWGFFGKMKSYASGAGAGGAVEFAAGRLESWLKSAGHLAVPEVIMKALDETGAWGVYAAGERGGQRLLNIGKLIDLARKHEREHSGGLRSFLEHLRERMEHGGKEGEAPVTGAEGGGVHFMTVHAAKGLEFPVVVVANACGHYQYGSGDVVYVQDVTPERLEVGLKLRGESAGEEDEYNTVMRNILNDLGRAREREEERRLLYVACTRARDYLVIAGHNRGPEVGEPEPAKEPGCWSDEIARATALEDGSEEKKMLDKLVEWKNSDGLEPANASAEIKNAVPDFIRVLESGDAEKETPDALKYFGEPPEFASGITVSATDLQLFDKDPNKYRLERILGVPAEWSYREGRSGGHEHHPAISPMTRGTAVHKLFEILPDVPLNEKEMKSRFEDILQENNVPAGKDADKLSRDYVGKALEFAASELGVAVCGAAESFRELPFSLKIGPHTLTGVIDVLFKTAGGWRVLDHKTDKIRPGEEKGKLDEYSLQLKIYGLAAMRGLGLDAVATGLYFIETGVATEPEVLSSFDAEKLENELLGKLDSLAEFQRR